MSKNPGRFVKWTDKAGNERKGIAYNGNQLVEGKVCIIEVDPVTFLKLNKPILMKNPDDVQVIGYTD